MGYFQEAGYTPYKIENYTVNTTEKHIEFKGASVFLHNKGTNTIYLSPVTPLDKDKSWEIAPGEKMGILSLNDEYVATATGDTVLKVMYLRGL